MDDTETQARQAPNHDRAQGAHSPAHAPSTMLQGVAASIGGAALHRKLLQRKRAGKQAASPDDKPHDEKSYDAQLFDAIQWGQDPKTGPGTETLHALQDALGVARSDEYDGDTAAAVHEKQKALKHKPDGKAGSTFCAAIGVIFTHAIGAAKVSDADAAAIEKSSPSGVSVSVFTQFNTKETEPGDKEFERRADEFAAIDHSVGYRGGAIVLGKSSPLTRLADLLQIVQGIHKGLLAKAGDKTPAPTWTKVRHLAIFTHGMEYGLDTNIHKHTYKDGLHKDSTEDKLQPSNVKAFVTGIADAITPDLAVQIYACSTGKDKEQTAFHESHMPAQGERMGEQSFAGELASELHKQGADRSNVFGHTTAKHTTQNPNARVFGEAAGDGGGGLHMFDVLYPESFIQEELERVVPDLETRSDEDRAGLHERMRAQMWEHYVDCIETEHDRENNRSKRRLAPHLGLEMFRDPTTAAATLRKDWTDYWLPRHLRTIIDGKEIKPSASPHRQPAH